MNNIKKIHELQNLIQRIEDVDEMVKLHSSDSSDFMLSQYQAKKEKLLGYLIDELANSKFPSLERFKLIMLALKKYYPDLNKKTGKGNIQEQLKVLEAELV